MRRRVMLALALIFGLVAAGAATWLLATLGPAGTPDGAKPTVHVSKTRVAAPTARPGDETGDEISQESREALREILREAE